MPRLVQEEEEHQWERVVDREELVLKQRERIDGKCVRRRLRRVHHVREVAGVVLEPPPLEEVRRRREPALLGRLRVSPAQPPRVFREGLR